jgi:flagellar biosynthetic protein FliS
MGLLVALYDTLAGNLRRAAAAQRANDIETRSHEAKHAFTVIGYLEDCVRRGSGGPLSQQLLAFYSTLRKKLVEAQARQSAEALEEQMESILKLREHWQTLDSHNSGLEPSEPARAGSMQPGRHAAVQFESRYGGWSV